jgi:hypothetical protein
MSNLTPKSRWTIDVDDLEKTHENPEFNDRYMVFMAEILDDSNEPPTVYRALCNRSVLERLYNKIGITLNKNEEP